MFTSIKNFNAICKEVKNSASTFEAQEVLFMAYFSKENKESAKKLYEAAKKTDKARAYLWEQAFARAKSLQISKEVSAVLKEMRAKGFDLQMLAKSFVYSELEKHGLAERGEIMERKINKETQQPILKVVEKWTLSKYCNALRFAMKSFCGEIKKEEKKCI